MVSRGMSVVASPLPPPNPAGSVGRNPYCGLTPPPRAPPPPFCTAPNQHLISTLQKPNARDLSSEICRDPQAKSTQNVCVGLVGWLGDWRRRERAEQTAGKRAVRRYREGVLVGALVEGVGIVVHARCREQLDLGFWRSSEQVYLDRCSVGCGRWREETGEGRR